MTYDMNMIRNANSPTRWPRTPKTRLGLSVEGASAPGRLDISWYLCVGRGFPTGDFESDHVGPEDVCGAVNGGESSTMSKKGQLVGPEGKRCYCTKSGWLSVLPCQQWSLRVRKLPWLAAYQYMSPTDLQQR